MIFIALAMMYYGLILFKLRNLKKIKDATLTSKANEYENANLIIRYDRFILAIYIMSFFLFNAFYFSKYYLI